MIRFSYFFKKRAGAAPDKLLKLFDDALVAPDKQTKQIYNWIKIGGFIVFIPAILSLGPLAGYFAGDYLQKRFNLPSYLPFFMAAIGFIASVDETIRIIRLIIKIDKKD